MDILQVFKDWLAPNKEHTGSTAKNRLKSMLVIDRSNVSPELMNDIKDDIIKVYQKYFELNDEDMEVKFDNNQNTVILTTSISVLRVKRNIDAANSKDDNDYKRNNANRQKR
ncbi:MAG: cell division topological specificity factor MinE [Negativicutes bacterium]|jgi:cell division topological specificity factor